MASNQDDQKEMGITIAPLSELDLNLEPNCNQALDFATFLNNFYWQSLDQKNYLVPLVGGGFGWEIKQVSFNNTFSKIT